MTKEALHNLSLYTKRFFSGTLLSRISGMGRDLSMAFAFGDHPSVAAFFVAFRFSNLLRRLLGEGPFQSAFIPHFEGLRIQDPARAALFFRRLVVFIGLVLLAMVGLAEGGIALLLSSSSLTDATREVIALTGWLFPGVIFICLYGLNLSLLNCYDSFFIPSVAPFVCNLIWIAAALFLCNLEASIAMPVLAKWVVIGFMGQWLLTLPFTLKHVSSTLKEWVSFKIPKEVVTLARSFTLGALGVGAVQINAFIDALFARHADLRGPVYLWYAIRFEQLALAIFGIACVSTIVPRLSRAIKAGDAEGAQTLFTFSHSRIWAVMLPCTFALLALGGAAINLFYGRGHFSELAVSETTLCLWAYTLGLIPATLVILYSALFYAKQNFRVPMLIAMFTVVISALLNALFVFVLEWGAVSIALATSISAWINAAILKHLAEKQGWKSDFRLPRIFSLATASLFAFCSVAVVEQLFLQATLLPLLQTGSVLFSRNSSVQLLQILVSSVVFLGALASYALLLKNRDLLDLFQELFLKKKAAQD